MAHVPAAQRRPQLIDAAIDLMRREGAAAGSTRAVAAELGVAQMTVHYVFGSKAEFTRAVFEELGRRIVDQVRPFAEHAAGGGFAGSLAHTVRVLWRVSTEDRGVAILWDELSVQALRDPVLREAYGEHAMDMLRVTTELLTTLAERNGTALAAPAPVVARFFLAAFEGLLSQHLAAPDEAAEQRCLEQVIAATVALATGDLPS
ncbi:TetR/AcrR family transcriptional regulator [Nocardiopsis changdeensis]|uniref:TetR/AcrR family transcriptional regulator n=1 Tax=Nocardiopsis changdeensis TaxID=2831969 RepID=A0ABX8BD82_9ACTN|nr:MULTISPECIES: TetR/AcrR family transcriptional regulator [Nocardiopsis]QUX20207.1 TetR/AcrR family transcriptional regulator [Nocardiopsis changdeensis]QYX36135.1 TetR/AcrR family transcriptional regulator [Nocardiopsis sp. MT53]